MENIPHDLIGMNEAARILTVSRTVVKRLIVQGKLPAFRVGARWRLSRADVLAQMTQFQPADKKLPLTMTERRRRDAETDRVLREAGIRK